MYTFNLFNSNVKLTIKYAKMSRFDSFLIELFCQSLFFGSVVTSSELKVFRAVLYLSDESYADVCLSCSNFIASTSVS